MEARRGGVRAHGAQTVTANVMLPIHLEKPAIDVNH